VEKLLPEGPGSLFFPLLLLLLLFPSTSLPDWLDRGSRPGKREGMVQMFKKEGKAIAAQWSQDSGTWIEIGEVMGSTNAGTIDGEWW